MEFKKLYPIKNGQKFKKFGVIDIEAQDWTKFLVLGLYTEEDGFRYFEGENGLSEFIDFLSESKIDIYFAHLGGKYDFLFILNQVFKNYPRMFVRAIPRGSLILMIELKINDRIISFYDSTALLQYSLRALTETFKVTHKKGDVDFKFLKYSYANKNYFNLLFKNKDIEVFYDGQKIDKPLKKYDISKVKYRYLSSGLEYKLHSKVDVLEYLKSDCIGLHEVLSKFYSMPLIRNAGQAFTIASQAMKVFRRYIDSEIPSLNSTLEERVRPSYFGGRTEIIRPYFYSTDKKIYCYDVNSLYPFVMKSYDYPADYIGKTKKLNFDYLSIYHCRVRVPDDCYLPPLPYKKDGKLIFPVGEFDGHWTSIELQNAIKYGVEIVKVYYGLLFENGGRIFENYINDLYRMRQNFPNGSVENFIAKILMNSLYGKFGQNRDKDFISLEDGKEGERELGEIIGLPEKLRLVYQKTKLDGFGNVAISAFVTAYARVYMYSNYWFPSLDELYYLDTDSLYTTKKFETSNELGKLKLEEESSQAIFILPKTYRTDNKLKMKGFESKAINFTFEEFSNALQGEINRLRYRTEIRPMTFRSAVRRKGEILTLAPEMEKRVISHYDKREVIKHKYLNNWVTRPHKIFDNQENIK